MSRFFNFGWAFLFATTLAMNLLAVRDAKAALLEFGDETGFIVDRCGGDYNCDDVELVLMTKGKDVAQILAGQQDNATDVDGSPSQAYGYSFGKGKGAVEIDASPATVRMGGKEYDLRLSSSIVLESDREYFQLSRPDCRECTDLATLIRQPSVKTFNVIVVAKQGGKTQSVQTDVTSDCSKCETGKGDILTACRGTVRFEIGGRQISIAGDPCTEDELKITEKTAGKSPKPTTLFERPAAM